MDKEKEVISNRNQGGAMVESGPTEGVVKLSSRAFVKEEDKSSNHQ